MASATIYVDNVNGNNGNTGLSEAQAFADIPTAIAAITGGGNTIYVQNAGSDYVLTATIAITAALKGDTTNGRNKIVGYTTTPGARDGRPKITSATNSVNLFTLNDNDYWEFVHLELTHTASTRGNCFNAGTSTSTPLYFTDLIVDGVLTFMGSTFYSATSLINCVIRNTTSTSQAFTVRMTGDFYGCYIHDNAGDGIRGGSAVVTRISLFSSIVAYNAGIGVNGGGTSSSYLLRIDNSTVAENTGDGIDVPANSSTTVLEISNNIIYGNSGEGLDQNDEQSIVEAVTLLFQNNAWGSNTGGNYSGISAGVGDVTLSADPFTNAGSRDFSLNNTAGGGAAVRELAFPTSFGSTTTSYRDIGASQHQDTGGGSSSVKFAPGWAGSFNG